MHFLCWRICEPRDDFMTWTVDSVSCSVSGLNSVQLNATQVAAVSNVLQVLNSISKNLLMSFNQWYLAKITDKQLRNWSSFSLFSIKRKFTYWRPRYTDSHCAAKNRSLFENWPASYLTMPGSARVYMHILYMYTCSGTCTVQFLNVFRWKSIHVPGRWWFCLKSQFARVD